MSSLIAVTARGRAVLAALVLALLALSAADADARAKGQARAPRKAAGCAAITKLPTRGGPATLISVRRAKGLACRPARKIVLRCMRGRLHKSWRAVEVRGVVWLRRGKRAVALRTISGREPRCVTRRLKRKAPAWAGLRGPLGARPAGHFGPYEAPVMYLTDDRQRAFLWDSPVATYEAVIDLGAITSIQLYGYVRNVKGEVRSVWFEYGETRDFGDQTAKQSVPISPEGGPAQFTAHLSHLRARTRYFWRAVANIEDDKGNPRVQYGSTGSFVTNPYPTLPNKARPCQGMPDSYELTESLLVVCQQRTFERASCFPSCVDFYGGKLQCTRDFARNLNAGSRSFTIPEVGISVSVNKLVSYWRSNDSNRFNEVPGKNANSEGSQTGPTPGWHNWDVGQWGYPTGTTRTDVDFWIYCTEQWGNVIDASSVARGQGNDYASSVGPSAPRNVKATATKDGGIQVTWDEPTSVSPSGIAGYTVQLFALRSGDPRSVDTDRLGVITTSTKSQIPATTVQRVTKNLQPGYKAYVVVGGVSREGSVGDVVTIPWS